MITFLSLLACANAQLLDIPAVDKLVSSALRPFEQYITQHAASAVTTAAASSKSDPPKVHALDAVAATADTPYWLADIAHQGIAAFNSDPASYTVFRNVKDYGAVGKGSMVIKLSSKC